MAWGYLILAGLFEVGFASFLKLSEGFTKLGPTFAFILCAVLSFGCLTRAMQTLPLGTTYAVWTGIGTSGTVMLGMLCFGDPVNLWRLGFLTLLMVSVIGLKIVAEPA